MSAPQYQYGNSGRNVLIGPGAANVDLSAFKSRPLTNELLHEATEVIMTAVAETLGELRGETPPKDLFDLRKTRKPADGEETA